MTFSSRLIEKAVETFASLPGIGRKTAFRLVLHLLKQDKSATEQFAAALVAMRAGIRECRVCHNLADEDVCHICADARRDRSLVCVVENIRDRKEAPAAPATPAATGYRNDPCDACGHFTVEQTGKCAACGATGEASGG